MTPSTTTMIAKRWNPCLLVMALDSISWPNVQAEPRPSEDSTSTEGCGASAPAPCSTGDFVYAERWFDIKWEQFVDKQPEDHDQWVYMPGMFTRESLSQH